MSTLSTLKLGTIEEEAAACRERWKDYGIGTLAAHLHHGMPFEMLTKPAEERITYILKEKPEDERALRLRCFAPIVNLSQFPKLQKFATTRKQVITTWLKARAKHQKIFVAWWKAEDALAKNKPKAEAKWWKVGNDLRNAGYDLWKAEVALWEIEAMVRKISATIPHDELCPLGFNCPWDGETIFSN
jgi:hypothetical protein